MKMALQSKNKFRFVDGSIRPPPITDPLFPTWERCNTMVVTWLTRSLSATIAQSILWIDKAYEIWDDLQSRYAQCDIFRVADLQDELHSLKQGDVSVSEYFTKLKIIWDELLNLRPLPICSCDDRCSCGAFDRMNKYQQQDYVIRFLKGLNDRYSTIKSQIMILDPLPSVNRVFSLVLQQEREMGLLELPTESKVFLNRSGQSQIPLSSQNRTTKHCTFCGKPRHNIETCYKKHGYPPGFKFRNQNSLVNNFVQEKREISDQVLPSQHSAPFATTAHLGFTAEQYHRLLQLVQNDTPIPTSSINHVSTSGGNHVSLTSFSFKSF